MVVAVGDLDDRGCLRLDLRFIGDTGLRVLANDLVVDVSIHRGPHEALSINCTQGSEG